MGNMNAKVGKDVRICNVGRYSLDEEPNDRGMRLTDFSTSINMVISSMRIPHKDIHKETWIYPDGKTNIQTDYASMPETLLISLMTHLADVLTAIWTII
jgi:hypothetical protein